jgi:hypothetical protein
MTTTECPCGRARAGCEYQDPELQTVRERIVFHYNGKDYAVETHEGESASSIASRIALLTGGTVQPDGAVLLPGCLHNVVIKGVIEV